MRMEFTPESMGPGVNNRACGEVGGNPAAVLGRGMQIGQWHEICQSFDDRVLNENCVERAAFQSFLGVRQPYGKVCRSSHADGDAVASTVVSKLDLRSGRHKGEVASSRVHLMEADPNLSEPHGKLHRRQYCISRQPGGHRPNIKVTRAYLFGATARA